MPILHARPCWSRFLEFDTSVRGATWWMLAMAMTDLIDASNNPRLMADLVTRCRSALEGLRNGSPATPTAHGPTYGLLPGTKIPPFTYTDEPVDKWSALSVAADTFPGQSFVVDCDDLVGKWGAFWKSRTGERRPINVGVAISQPKTRNCCLGPNCKSGRVCGHGMAHTYNVLDLGPEFSPSSDFCGALIKSDVLCDHLSDAGYAGSEGVWVWDGSTAAGMNQPGSSFYGSGETAVLWMPEHEGF